MRAVTEPPPPKTLITPALFSRPPRPPRREKRENCLRSGEASETIRHDRRRPAGFPTGRLYSGGPVLIITDGFCDVLRVRREHGFLIPAGGGLPFPPRGPVFRVR